MPDSMYDGSDGMLVIAVTVGKPAAIGGMKDGDIIAAVDGRLLLQQSLGLGSTLIHKVCGALSSTLKQVR